MQVQGKGEIKMFHCFFNIFVSSVTSSLLVSVMEKKPGNTLRRIKHFSWVLKGK